jgi:hypothetical protein
MHRHRHLLRKHNRHRRLRPKPRLPRREILVMGGKLALLRHQVA